VSTTNFTARSACSAHGFNPGGDLLLGQRRQIGRAQPLHRIEQLLTGFAPDRFLDQALDRLLGEE
jgi:hypothetical protein